MTKEILIQYCDLQKEVKDLEKRIDRLEKQTTMISDVVQNGYKRHAVIFGVDIQRQSKLETYKNKLQIFYNKLFDLQNQIEDYIETISDSAARQIFRYRYLDSMSWNQIQILMKYKHEDTARKRHDKFLEEIL